MFSLSVVILPKAAVPSDAQREAPVHQGCPPLRRWIQRLNPVGMPEAYSAVHFTAEIFRGASV
jgi:hypothetical protein